MNLKGCYSKASDNWRTPSPIYEKFINNGYIDCFPFLADYDEFQKVYKNQKLFVNPPYSKLKLIPEWLKKQLDNGCEVVLLIPARTDTSYFHEMLKFNPKIEFVKGRLHFNDSKNSAPFPSIFMFFKEKQL